MNEIYVYIQMKYIMNKVKDYGTEFCVLEEWLSVYANQKLHYFTDTRCVSGIIFEFTLDGVYLICGKF